MIQLTHLNRGQHRVRDLQNYKPAAAQKSSYNKQLIYFFHALLPFSSIKIFNYRIWTNDE